LCALITDPPVVVLDEPLSGLGPEAAQRTKTWLKHLTRTRAKTVVLTTRHPEVAQDLCDRVAIIAKGHLVAEVSPADLANKVGPDYYHIKVKSHLTDRWSDWFDNLVMTYTPAAKPSSPAPSAIKPRCMA
jgi:ABC-2 type transport system ATP-binding protein